MERYIESKEPKKINIWHKFRWNNERGATGSICKRVSSIGIRVERAAMAAMARDARGGDAGV
jgi:hypothetical protein